MNRKRSHYRLAIAASLLAAACGSEPQKTEAPAPPAPTPKTVEQRIARYQECWEHFNKKAWEPFKGCYDATATSEAMGSGQPVLTGVDPIVAGTKSFADSYPDMEGTLALIIAREDTIVSLAHQNGTNTGPVMGPDGKSMPATGKPVGFMMGHVVRWDPMGEKVVREELYSDSATVMAQLGINKAPARPVMAKYNVGPTVVISTKSDTEAKNIAAFQAQADAFGKGDLKTVSSFNAPDAVFHDLTSPKDLDAKGNDAMVASLFKGFPDAKLVTSSLWGAENYIVAQGTFEGTNKGAVPTMGIRRATGKAVKVPFLEVTRYVDGKVKEDWLIFESMAFAQQLGLMPPAK